MTFGGLGEFFYVTQQTHVLEIFYLCQWGAEESKKQDDEIRKRRKKFRNIRRLTKVKDDHPEELAQACPRSVNVSQSQQTWRGGLPLNGENQVEGEGEGVWVPADNAITEQPQDSVQQENLKNGTQGLISTTSDFK